MEDFCIMRNVHSYTPRSCDDRCCLCTAYIPPIIILVICLSLAGGYNAYFVVLCIKFHTEWRLAVCIISLVVGDMATALLLWAFYRVVTTAAGYVSSEPWKYPPTYVGKSPDYRPPNSADPVVNPYTVTQLDRNNRLRFCEQCGQFKPDRAHHCTMCGRCTYRFDHHCPVVNNCIGRENYKMFVLFLMYAALAGFLDGGLMLLGFFVIEDGDWSVLWLMVAVLMMLLSSSVFLFGLTHVWWLSRGESTMSIRVASYDKSKRLPSAERRAERDIERRKHWDAVLGSDRRWWRVILPLRPTRTSEEVPI